MAVAKVINTEMGQCIIVPNDCLLGCDEVVMVQRDSDSYLITPKNIADRRFKDSLSGFDDSFFAAMKELEHEKEIQRKALQEYYDSKKERKDS